MTTPGRPSTPLESAAVDVHGVRRPYWLRPPPARPAPIVLSLHGRGTRPAWQAWISGMDGYAAAHGAAVAFPCGSVVWGADRFDWDHAADTPYLAAVIADLRTRFGGADDRVLLAGMSAGARMASHYASVRAADVALLGAVAGLRAPTAVPARPVPVVAFHGTADRLNPYAGGATARWRESVPDAARAWAAANGAPPSAEVAPVARHVTRTTYGAGTGSSVTLFRVENAGHTWPGLRGTGLVMRWFLGRTSLDVDATAELWRGFESVRSREGSAVPR